MATVSTPLGERARTIFTDLGYAVSDGDGEFRAERKWRTVRVTPVTEMGETPRAGDMRCFVTWRERAPSLRSELRRTDPDYDWAVIGVDEEGDYRVFGGSETLQVPT